MRIITGSARGARLTTLEGDATRPTAERVKEGMFSAIQFDLHDRKVLEPFGGSGQLSLEALSRGAESALICDESREAVAVIKENAKKARLFERCSIIACDWKDCLRGAREKYSLVFLDPPYKEGVLDFSQCISFNLDGGVNNAWFLLRLSVHDPVMPLNAESDVPGGVKRMLSELCALLEGVETLDLGPLKAAIGK